MIPRALRRSPSFRRSEHILTMHNLRKLDVWKVSRQLSRVAYGLTMNRPLSLHSRLREQIRGAATSIPANLAEGYGLVTKPQLIKGLRISLGSAYELREHLDLAHDMELISASDHEAAHHLTTRAIALIIGTLKGLDSR